MLPLAGLVSTEGNQKTLKHEPQKLLSIPGARAPAVPLAGLVSTAKEREASWCARRRGCSPRGTVRMCSFWISSIPPIAIAPSFASARLSGNAALLKLAMKFTCAPHTFVTETLKALNVGALALAQRDCPLTWYHTWEIYTLGYHMMLCSPA